jgi:hypothetical protein
MNNVALLRVPEYSELEIALTPKERIYSKDRKHRVYWEIAL